MSELSSNIELVETLDDETTRDMFALYRRYYGGTSEKLFNSDLADKAYVILVRDTQDRLQGFSTVAVTEHRFEGAPIRALYSGDTIVEERHWGQYALSFAWFRLAGAIKAAALPVPLYWFLTVKGHRTYRYLPAIFRVFYPAHDRSTPRRERELMDMLARERFGDAYDADTGLVRYPTSRGHLKSTWAEVPEKDRQRPDVLFFLERNPAYAEGHELVCLCELTPENHRPLMRRLFCAGMEDRNMKERL